MCEGLIHPRPEGRGIRDLRAPNVIMVQSLIIKDGFIRSIVFLDAINQLSLRFRLHKGNLIRVH